MFPTLFTLLICGKFLILFNLLLVLSEDYKGGLYGVLQQLISLSNPDITRVNHPSDIKCPTAQFT